ncbi:glycosyltransferase family 4 protein [Candidatus Pacearchaeota archaeon]|nr:glycosyltransferase family 4 protein [Candidatus Pacearchaeota archaeon]
MKKQRVVFLGYGDASPSGPGKSKTVFYITKGLYQNGLLVKSLVRDFDKRAINTIDGLRKLVIKPIPFGNLIPKFLGAIGKILKLNINNRYYSERLFSLCSRRWLLKNKDKYDIVMGTVRLAEAFKDAKKLGKITVLYASGEHPLSFREKYRKEREKWKIQNISPTRKDKHLFKYKESIEFSDYIIALSRESKKTYIKYGYDNNKIYVCPPGVHIGQEGRINESLDSDRKDGFNVVFMGRVDVLKGVQYLLEAWRKVDLPDNAVLHICGKRPPGAAKIIRHFKDLKNVHYPGFVDPRKYFQKADLFVLPTLSEGFGRSVLDAMSHGLAGIVTPMAAEPIIDQKNGIIVPSCDSDSIAFWLKKLYDDKELRKRIGFEARKVTEKYSWENYCRNIALIIENIMSKKESEGECHKD